MPLTKPYFPALTGIRAVAAYLVFFFHFNPLKGTTHFQWFEAIIWQWHIGVSIFFVLSGFLITTRYRDRIEPTASWIKRYLINRFARIYPIYFLLTAATFLVTWLGSAQLWYGWPHSYTSLDKGVTLALNLTLLRGFFSDFLFLGMPTAWSLTVEECFYISAPLVLLALKQNRFTLFFYPLIVLCMGFLLVGVCPHLSTYGGLMKDRYFMLNWTFFGRVTEFAIGIGLAVWAANPRGVTWRGRGATYLGGAGIVLCLLALTYLRAVAHIETTIPHTPAAVLVNNMALPVAVAVFFYGLLREPTWLQKMLSTPLLSALGKSSYVFYLIHVGFINELVTHYISPNTWAKFLVMIVLSLGMYYGIEHPLNTWIKAIAFKKRPRTQVA